MICFEESIDILSNIRGKKVVLHLLNLRTMVFNNNDRYHAAEDLWSDKEPVAFFYFFYLVIQRGIGLCNASNTSLIENQYQYRIKI